MNYEDISDYPVYRKVKSFTTFDLEYDGFVYS